MNTSGRMCINRGSSVSYRIANISFDSVALCRSNVQILTVDEFVFALSDEAIKWFCLLFILQCSVSVCQSISLNKCACGPASGHS